MSRTKGTFQTANNYELGKRKPLDARQLVSSVADLTNVATWEKYKNDDGTAYNNAFNGMIVAVAEDASLYILKDKDQITSLDSGWVKLGATRDSAVYYVQDLSELPNIGQTETLYIILSKNIFMYWDFDQLKYVRIGTDWRDIEIIDGGSAEFIKEKVISDYSPA